MADNIKEKAVERHAREAYEEVLALAFERVRAHYNFLWLHSEPNNVDGREVLHAQTRVIADVEAQIKVMMNAETARQHNEEMQAKYGDAYPRLGVIG